VLILSRKKSERIRIRTPFLGDVIVTVTRTGKNGSCQLGIDAPDDFVIVREAADGSNQTGQGRAGGRLEPCQL